MWTATAFGGVVPFKTDEEMIGFANAWAIFHSGISQMIVDLAPLMKS
jgi:hypothetical protein